MSTAAGKMNCRLLNENMPNGKNISSCTHSPNRTGQSLCSSLRTSISITKNISSRTHSPNRTCQSLCSSLRTNISINNNTHGEYTFIYVSIYGLFNCDVSTSDYSLRIAILNCEGRGTDRVWPIWGIMTTSAWRDWKKIPWKTSAEITDMEPALLE